MHKLSTPGDTGMKPLPEGLGGVSDGTRETLLDQGLGMTYDTETGASRLLTKQQIEDPNFNIWGD
jgi:hypothetical protein